MSPELTTLAHLRRWLQVRRDLARNENGYSTEAVIVTALLVAIAVAAVAIIGVKVMSKANGIATE